MKSDIEMTREILAEVKHIKGKRKRFIIKATVCVVMTVALTAAFVVRTGVSPEIPDGTGYSLNLNHLPNDSTDNTTTATGTTTSTTEQSAQTTTTNDNTIWLTTSPTLTTQPTNDLTEATSDIGGTYGDGSGRAGAPPLKPITDNFSITEVGEEITDEEAAVYLSENLRSITSSLSANGVPADDLRISERGYCHINILEDDPDRAELRQNFRDYLVYNGETLVAIITLYKENGKFYQTPAFGGPWFSDYDAFLKAHKGQELIFVYSGFLELILSPDGTITCPVYPDITGVYGTDHYRMLYNPKAVYVP